MNETITLTFGDAGENHIGMEIIGEKGNIGSGFNKLELKNIRKEFKKLNYETKLYNLNKLVNENTSCASLLVIKDGLKYFLGKSKIDDMFKELTSFEWDKKYYDTRRKKVLNKRARENVCFGEFNQNPDYINKKGTIIAYDDLPLLKKVKNKLPLIIGEKGNKLICEGNRYFDISKCGIGWHGDGERKKVIAFRLGVTLPLKFQWFHQNKPIGDVLDIKVENGDMYIMSEHATGNNWKKSSLYSLRHCAGSEKYTKPK